MEFLILLGIGFLVLKLLPAPEENNEEEKKYTYDAGETIGAFDQTFGGIEKKIDLTDKNILSGISGVVPKIKAAAATAAAVALPVFVAAVFIGGVVKAVQILGERAERRKERSKKFKNFGDLADLLCTVNNPYAGGNVTALFNSTLEAEAEGFKRHPAYEHLPETEINELARRTVVSIFNAHKLHYEEVLGYNKLISSAELQERYSAGASLNDLASIGRGIEKLKQFYD